MANVVDLTDLSLDEIIKLKRKFRPKPMPTNYGSSDDQDDCWNSGDTCVQQTQWHSGFDARQRLDALRSEHPRRCLPGRPPPPRRRRSSPIYGRTEHPENVAREREHRRSRSPQNRRNSFKRKPSSLALSANHADCEPLLGGVHFNPAFIGCMVNFLEKKRATTQQQRYDCSLWDETNLISKSKEPVSFEIPEVMRRYEMQHAAPARAPNPDFPQPATARHAAFVPPYQLEHVRPKPVMQPYTPLDRTSRAHLDVLSRAVESFHSCSSMRPNGDVPDPYMQRYGVIVSNLDVRVTTEDIKILFGRMGDTLDVQIVRPGVAKIVYERQEHARAAANYYNNRSLDGLRMNCIYFNSI